MKQGDIILTPFPFTDLSETKLRPALILSNSSFNTKKNLILMCISTKQGDRNFSEILGQEDLQSGKLQKQSFLRFQNVFTLEKRLAIKTVGKLDPKKLNKVLTQYQSYFSIDDSDI